MFDTPADLSPSTRRTSEVNRRESRTGNRSSKASSEGSCVQPSMGIPFAIQMVIMRIAKQAKQMIITRTFIYRIANWRIVDQAYTGKICLN